MAKPKGAGSGSGSGVSKDDTLGGRRNYTFVPRFLYGPRGFGTS